MRTDWKRRTECGLTAAVVVIAAGTAASPGGAAPPTWDTSYEKYAGKPSISIPATFRDFKPAATPGGQVDFGKTAAGGPGRYVNIAAPLLGSTGTPVFMSTGNKVLTDWRDSTGRVIPQPHPYIPAQPGDKPGSISTSPGGAVTSAASFGQWFSDVPGTNVTTQKPLTFTQSSVGNYVLDGTLDSFKGTPDFDYTSEMSYYFVYEQGKDWFIDLNTDAEAWVYVDGKLVLDGTGGGAVNFQIINGVVVPGEPVAAAVTIVGAAITSNGVKVPVTVQAKVGTAIVQPFGPYAKAITGNVNDDKNPRTAVLSTLVAPGTGISVAGTSWLKTSSGLNSLLDSSYSKYITVDSSSGSQAVKVLRNGDAVPNITPYQNQATIASFLAPYMDLATKKVKLGQNQAIYLFELGTTTLTSAAADFQDVVVLLTLAKDASSLPLAGNTLPSSTAMPGLTQRIWMDRMTWMKDHSTHRVQIFYANRSGAASHLRMETNIRTLNLASRIVVTQTD